MAPSLQDLLEEHAAGRWRVEPLPNGSYRVGDGPGYLIFFTGQSQAEGQSQAIQYLVFSIRQSQKLQQSQDLEVIAFRKGQSAAASKRSALRHFKGAVNSEGHLEEGIRDLLRIDIKRPGKRPFFPVVPMPLRKRKGVPMRVGTRKRVPLPWKPRERFLQRIEQIRNSEAAPSRERLRDKLVADLKAVEALLWNGCSFPGSVAQIAKSLGRVPTKGEIAEELCISQDHCSKLCKQYGFAWLPWRSSRRTLVGTRSSL